MTASGFARRLAEERPPADGLLVFALGQAGFALRGASALVLIDPWLSTALEEAEGIARPVPPALRPDQVEGADLVCITHEHADHLDPVALAAIAERLPEAAEGDAAKRRGSASFLAPRPAVALVEAAGVPGERILAALPGETVEAAGARITAVPAAHELMTDTFGGYRFWLDEQGEHRGLGYLVELEGHRVFHAGDTIWWPGLQDELRGLAPELAILPINGRDAMREAQGLWGNLSAEEAAALAAAAGVPAVVPCHFDGVAGNLGDPSRFVIAAHECEPAIRAHVLHPGDELHLSG